MSEPTLAPSAQGETFVGAGGLRLYTRCWGPVAPATTPRAIVALVHGVSEYSGRYNTVVGHLTASGFALCAFDNRGHGKSPGQWGHINDWSEYREDMRAFLDHVRARFPGVPIVLYGHSLGALIVAEYLLSNQDGLAGAVLSGIPLKPTGVAKAPLVLVARMFSQIWPTFSLSLDIDGSRLSRDPEMVRAYNTDPMIHHRATARWGTETLAAIDHVRARASEIRLPVLILHGEADPVNSVEGSRELFEKISSSDKQLRVYPGGMHEPHNDIQRNEVVREVEKWLKDRTGTQ